jgi:SAM-dependent methyltransferase
MGIGISAFKFLLRENQRQPFSGKVLQLGRQDIVFTMEDAQQAARCFNFKLPEIPAKLSAKPAFAAQHFLSDETVFKLLGFAECRAADVSSFESADYLFDLNDPDVPAQLRESFDVVVDSGTLEHVFHVPNALANIFKLLRPGGRIIHISPSSNHVDHGFYMFSPTLFYDFYTANEFEINVVKFFRYTIMAHIDPWDIVDYTPGRLQSVSFGGLDNNLYGIICVATKTAASTAHRVPQQGAWIELWNRKEPQSQQVQQAQPAKRPPWYRPVKKAYDHVCRWLRYPVEKSYDHVCRWLLHRLSSRIPQQRKLELTFDERL